MAITIDGTNGLSSDNAALKLDGTTLAVDETNNRVGVGTASPAVAMDVVGQVRASTGILFGSDTAAANALDDYEEGTFTPEVADATTGGNTATGTFSGNYTKIGSVVVVNLFLNNIVTTGMTSGNSLIVRNLPFTSGSQFAQGAPFFDRITFSGYAIANVINNATYLDFRECVSNAADVNLTVSDINVSGTSDIGVSVTYLTF